MKTGSLHPSFPIVYELEHKNAFVKCAHLPDNVLCLLMLGTRHLAEILENNHKSLITNLEELRAEAHGSCTR